MRTMTHGRTRLSARLGAALLLVASTIGGFVLPSQPALADPGSYFDGQPRYSSVIDCFSIIQGSPYSERGAGAWVGVYTDADGDPDGTAPIPAVNQTVYMHIFVSGLGNPCSSQYFLPAIDLPANVSFDQSQSILCFTASGQTTLPSDCPQWSHVHSFPYEPGAQGYYSTDAGSGHTWPLAQGSYWEFRFPVKSTTVQTNSTLRGYVKMLDGNDSPVLHPTSPMYVFAPSSPPSILYDTPSTFAAPHDPVGGATTYGILSEATIATQGHAGTPYFNRTKADGTTWDGPVTFPLDTSATSWLVYTDWDLPGTFDALTPHTTYKWKVGFDPDPPGSGGGRLVYGSVQTFKSLAAPECMGRPVTVGLQFGQFPTSGNDVIMGTSHADNIDAGAGNDRICALGGNDTVIGGAGNDRIDGGAGNDTASYAGSSSAVVVSLATTRAQDTRGAGTDTITGTENLTGGNGNDRLAGNKKKNALVGYRGNDVLRGGKGNDTLSGGPGRDVLQGGPGRDVISGGRGSDTATYAGISAAVVVSLATTRAQDTRGAGTDTITGTENLTGGSGNDRLAGNKKRNTLKGGRGRDRCRGGAGHDIGVSCEITSGIP